jgi:zinc transporter
VAEARVRVTEISSGATAGHAPMPGLVWAFRFGVDGAAREIAVDQPLEDDGAGDGWLWLHFNLADARACLFLRSVSYLPPAARELLVASDEHQQLHAKDGCLYGVLADLVCGLEGATGEIGFLHFAMTERLLVTSRRRMLSAVEATRQAVRKGQTVGSVVALLEAIMEQVVDSVDHYADELAGTLDHLEERILVDDVNEGRQTLGRVRRTTVRLHRQLAILRQLIHRFELGIGHAQQNTFRLATAKLGQRVDWLDAEIVALRDRAHLLQEEVTLKTAEQTNRNLQVLAIVTTVFLPASLIAGIFGMNVGGVPLTDNRHGFLWVMLLVVVVSVLVYWLLKRSGILGR